MSRSCERFASATLKYTAQLDLSGGMGLFLIQLPQEYWKKSTQGSTVRSIEVTSSTGAGLVGELCADVGRVRKKEQDRRRTRERTQRHFRTFMKEPRAGA